MTHNNGTIFLSADITNDYLQTCLKTCQLNWSNFWEEGYHSVTDLKTVLTLIGNWWTYLLA